MPLYVYKCPVCGAVREEQRKIAEMDAPISCTNNPDCNGAGDAPSLMQRIPTAPSPIFPGASSWRSR